MEKECWFDERHSHSDFVAYWKGADHWCQTSFHYVVNHVNILPPFIDNISNNFGFGDLTNSIITNFQGRSGSSWLLINCKLYTLRRIQSEAFAQWKINNFIVWIHFDYVFVHACSIMMPLTIEEPIITPPWLFWSHSCAVDELHKGGPRTVHCLTMRGQLKGLVIPYGDFTLMIEDSFNLNFKENNSLRIPKSYKTIIDSSSHILSKHVV